MRTLVFRLLVAFTVASPTRMVAQQVDTLTCNSGYVHHATNCGGCGQYKGSVLMCPPPGSSTVRQVEIRIPQEFRSTTKIKLKIRPLRGKGPKMVVKSTKINGTAPNEHQIAVEATTPSATDVKYVLTYSVRTE